MSYKYNPFKDVIRFKNRRKAPGSASNILKRALNNRGLSRDIDRYQYVLHWEEILGKDLASKIKPGYLRGEFLVLEVPNSMWAQELSFKKDSILDALRPFLTAGQVVNDIAFEISGK